MVIAVKWVVVAAAVVAISADVAAAADVARPAPLPAPTYSWIGWYGGLNAGAVWGDENVAWTGQGFSASGASDVNNSSPGIFQNPYAQSVQSNWLSTIRGRLGITYGSALFYGTGGLAIAQVKFTDSFLGLHGVGPINASVSDTRVGWSAGGGAEWAIAPGWSGKIEYLHADLGSVTNLGMSAFNPARINNAHSVTEDLVRLGVNYRWGGDPVLDR